MYNNLQYILIVNYLSAIGYNIFFELLYSSNDWLSIDFCLSHLHVFLSYLYIYLHIHANYPYGFHVFLLLRSFIPAFTILPVYQFVPLIQRVMSSLQLESCWTEFPLKERQYSKNSLRKHFYWAWIAFYSGQCTICRMKCRRRLRDGQ